MEYVQLAMLVTDWDHPCFIFDVLLYLQFFDIDTLYVTVKSDAKSRFIYYDARHNVKVLMVFLMSVKHKPFLDGKKNCSLIVVTHLYWIPNTKDRSRLEMQIIPEI